MMLQTGRSGRQTLPAVNYIILHRSSRIATLSEDAVKGGASHSLSRTWVEGDYPRRSGVTRVSRAIFIRARLLPWYAAIYSM